MPYIDNVPHAGSAEVLFTGMFDEFTGTIARTIPRPLVSSSSLPLFTTGGQVAVHAIPLAAGMVVSNIAILFGTTGATGPTHYWHALADIQLNILAVTADQLAAAQNASTFTKIPVTIPYLVPATGLYTILASSSATTTAPTIAGNGLPAGVGAGPPILCGTAGNQATPPAIGTQLAGGVIAPAGSANFAAWLS